MEWPLQRARLKVETEPPPDWLGRNVRYRVTTGKHRLRVSISGFGPEADFGVAKLGPPQNKKPRSMPGL
jgi:hypothetical protein